MLGFTGLFIVLFIPKFFSVRTITQCKFHSEPHASKGVIAIFDHIFHGYSNRQLHFSHINFAHIVSWTSNGATYDVYSPELIEILIHGQCCGYFHLYCV